MTDDYSEFKEDDFKIQAICYDLGISMDDALLYMFLHKIALKKSIDYLNEENPLFLETLKLLLYGTTDDFTSKLKIENKYLIPDLEKMIISLNLKEDEKRARELGYESFVTSMLEQAIKFYENKDFRKEKLKFYEEEISPKLPEYNENKVKKAFEQAGKRIKAQTNFLDNLYKK